jgi:hypothetical protein
MDLDNIEWLHIARDVQNHIYTVFSAGKSANIYMLVYGAYIRLWPALYIVDQRAAAASKLAFCTGL